MSSAADMQSEPVPAATRTCDSCGAPVEPHDKFCQACGTPQPVEQEVAATPQKHLRCDSCGAQITIDPQERSYTCPFCDSTYVVELDTPETGRQPPEFVIGFAITPDAALEKFHEWLGAGGWFRPSDLKMAQIDQRLRGVYLPFWSFSLLAYSQWSASVGEHWYRTETYTVTVNGKTETRTRQVQETEWWQLAGQFHHYYNGYLVSASRGLSQQDADRISPFQLPALKRYSPSFLAGWACEEYQIERDQALETTQRWCRDQQQKNIGGFLPGDTHRSIVANTTFSDINSDLILLPVYVLSYRYRDKLYRFLLNGQTGKTVGDKPLSYRRIAATVVVSIVAVVGLIAILSAIFNR